MARWLTGVVLIGLGVFGIVLAIIMPTVVVPASKKTPLDLDITQISSGPAKLLDAATGKQQDVRLRATRIVRTDSNASDRDNTTVDASLCIVVIKGSTPNCVKSSDPRLLSVTTDRVTSDRTSAEAVDVPKWGANVNGDTSVKHTGLSYKWPIDAEKKTYQFFLPDLKRAFPATYLGTAKVRGLDVYRYQAKTGDQPYKIQGVAAGTYNDTRTVWVEPQTGVIVKGVEREVQTLADGTLALDTTLTFEDSAIDYQSNYAKGKIDDLRKAGVYLPIIAGVVGLIALIGGILLVRPRSSAPVADGGAHPDDAPPPDAGPNFGQPPPDAQASSQT